MSRNATTAAALAGGYLLGRTKKAKLALGVGIILAGRRLDLAPLRTGTLSAASSVTGSPDGQVIKELVEATKSAAAHALTQRAIGLAGSLHRRMEGRGRAEEFDEAGDGADDEYIDEYADEYVDERADEPVDEYVDEEEEPGGEMADEADDESADDVSDLDDDDAEEEEEHRPAARSRRRSTSGGS
ncbi:hypothetical protein ACTU45_29745 [Streptomyces sp. 24-1644]|uniref:hypothetical protein n=1 Tax=Streptomyces sp. 24-1644 TaxID=3457315 RepID=UPI003FA7CC42